MAFRGEYFVDRYGKEAVKHTPPVAKMLALDVPVGLGTDATRVASYNPWTALYWLVSGRTVGGMAMYDDANRLPRDVALELWTAGSARSPASRARKAVWPPVSLPIWWCCRKTTSASRKRRSKALSRC